MPDARCITEKAQPIGPERCEHINEIDIDWLPLMTAFEFLNIRISRAKEGGSTRAFTVAPNNGKGKGKGEAGKGLSGIDVAAAGRGASLGRGGGGKGDAGKGDAGKGRAGKGSGAGKAGKGAAGKGDAGKGGGRGGGRGGWVAESLRISYTPTYKAGVGGKGEEAVWGIELVSEIGENAFVREAAEGVFRDMINFQWDRSKKAYAITTRANVSFDVTPEMANLIATQIREHRRGGSPACPLTAAMIERTNFDALDVSVIDHGVQLRRPKVKIWHTNTAQDSNYVYYDELMFVWGDTFAFREWFVHGNEPGGGWYTSDVATYDPTSTSAIGKCYTFDASRTFNRNDSEGIPQPCSLAEYLESKFGFEVNELAADLWVPGEDEENVEDDV